MKSSCMPILLLSLVLLFSSACGRRGDNFSFKSEEKVVGGGSSNSTDGGTPAAAPAGQVSFTGPNEGAFISRASRPSTQIHGVCNLQGGNVELTISDSVGKSVVATEICQNEAWSLNIDVSALRDGTLNMSLRILGSDNVYTAPVLRSLQKDTEPFSMAEIEIFPWTITPNGVGSDATPELRVGGLPSGSAIKIFSGSTCLAGTLLSSATLGSLGGDLILPLTDLGSDGFYTFYFIVADPAGNESTCLMAPLGYELDRVPPTAIVSGAPTGTSRTNPVNASVYGVSVVSYIFKVEDILGLGCNSPVGYSAMRSTTLSISAALDSLLDGVVRLCVLGYDSAGNRQGYDSATEVSWTKKTTLPQLTITSPIGGTIVNSANNSEAFPVQGTCDQATQSVTVFINDVSVGASNCNGVTFSKNVSTVGLVTGSFNITASLSDSVGNTRTTAPVTLYKDSVPPATPTPLTLHDPALSPSNDPTPSINIGGVSAGDLIQLYGDLNCTQLLQSGTATGTSINLTAPALTQGAYTFYATSTDSYGNSSPCSVSSVAYVYEVAVSLQPQITAASPSSLVAIQGGKLRVIGENLQTVNSVTLGGQNCSNIQYINNDNLYCDAPTLSSGTYDLVVSNPAALTDTLPNAVSYLGSVALSIEPSSLEIYPHGIWQFSAHGGVPPYTFTLIGGSGSVSPTGLYTNQGGTDIVRVTDGGTNTQDLTITVLKPVFTICTDTGTFSPAGILYDSGGVSGGYSAHEDCLFKINLGVSRQTDVSISSLSTELNYDLLEIFSSNGALKNWLASYSGTSGGGLPINQPEIDIQFVSDGGNNSTGFKADWQTAAGAPLRIGAAKNVLRPDASETLIASGGHGPYYFSVVAGGGSLTTVAGNQQAILFRAPKRATSTLVRVHDSLGAMADFSFQVAPEIAFQGGQSIEMVEENVGTVQITVSTPVALDQDIDIPLVLSGDAQMGLDFTASSAVQILAGQTQAQLQITIIDEGLYEFNEDIFIDLSSQYYYEKGSDWHRQIRILRSDYTSEYSLDPAFNGGGIFTYDRAGNKDMASVVAVDSSNRIVVGGQNYTAAASYDLGIFRLTSAGGLDTAFNTTGIRFITGAAYYSPMSLQLIGGGAPLVASSAYQYAFLWKLTTTGAMDTTFDTDGKSPQKNSYYRSGEFVTMPDGGYVQVHQAYYGDGVELRKFTSTGTTDSTFGSAGLYTLKPYAQTKAERMVVDPTGRIIGVGTANIPNWSNLQKLFIYRLTASGALDTTFASGIGYSEVTGALVTGETAVINKVLLDSNGDLFVIGTIFDISGQSDMAVWKIKGSDGSLDMAFANSGLFRHHNGAYGNGNDRGQSAMIEASSGKLLVVGCSARTSSAFEMVVWRLLANGTLDTSFSTTGLLNLNTTSDDCGYGVTFDSAGRLIVVGQTAIPNNANTNMRIWVLKK